MSSGLVSSFPPIQCTYDSDAGLYRCCSIGCNFTSPKRSTVNSHYEANHSGKTFECTECNAVFKFPQTLRQHQRKHERQAEDEAVARKLMKLAEKDYVDGLERGIRENLYAIEKEANDTRLDLAQLKAEVKEIPRLAKEIEENKKNTVACLAVFSKSLHQEFKDEINNGYEKQNRLGLAVDKLKFGFRRTDAIIEQLQNDNRFLFQQINEMGKRLEELAKNNVNFEYKKVVEKQ